MWAGGACTCVYVVLSFWPHPPCRLMLLLCMYVCLYACRGYIILGKRVEQATPAGAPQRYTFMVSAFQIPFGKALAMRPLVWHCDAGVTGAWTVGYTAAPRFTTWLLRQQGSKAGGGGSQQLQRAPVRFVTNNN